MSRRLLYAGASLRVGHVVARPAGEGRIEVEAPGENVLALPLSGVFARHRAADGDSIATPAHGVFFPANQPYRLSFPGGIGDEVLTLQWSDAALSATLPGAGIRESHVLLDPQPLLRRALLWRRLARGEADDVEIEEHAVALLASCLRPLRDAKPRRSRAGGRERIARVKEAIGVAPERKWTLADLAAVARLSPFHLAHVFRREVGVPVYAYVLRARLAKALPEVLEPGASITRIALDAGFASHSHFTARFRAFFGAPPAAVRREAAPRSAAQLRKIVAAR